MWHLIETVHAVTYFSPICRESHTELGFKGFWMSYFGTRAAPMGAVGPAVVTAAFGGFEPSMVSRALPDAWDYVSPDDAVNGRARAGAAAIRDALPDCEDVAESLLGVMDKALDVCELSGRALFAANHDVTPFEDPVEDLWQMCTTLREHRGDGHLAALTAEGVGGCEAHVLALASRGEGLSSMKGMRGWSDQDWNDAITTLRVAGVLEGALPADALVAPSEGAPSESDQETDDVSASVADAAVPTLTERGARLHADLESRTDDLASAPYAAIGESGREHMRDGLIPIASAIVEKGWIPFPNPIGLPQVV